VLACRPEKSEFDDVRSASVDLHQRIQRFVNVNNLTVSGPEAISGVQIRAYRSSALFWPCLGAARSTRIRRIAFAETAKECTRSCQVTPTVSTSRRKASRTKAVACKVLTTF
jgi:hypothetical protein